MHVDDELRRNENDICGDVKCRCTPHGCPSTTFMRAPRRPPRRETNQHLVRFRSELVLRPATFTPWALTWLCEIIGRRASEYTRILVRCEKYTLEQHTSFKFHLRWCREVMKEHNESGSTAKKVININVVSSVSPSRVTRRDGHGTRTSGAKNTIRS